MPAINRLAIARLLFKANWKLIFGTTTRVLLYAYILIYIREINIIYLKRKFGTGRLLLPKPKTPPFRYTLYVRKTVHDDPLFVAWQIVN